MNKEKKTEKRVKKVEGVSKKVKQSIKRENWDEIQKKKNGKAVGPDDIPIEP